MKMIEVKCKIDGTKLFEIKDGNIEIVCKKDKRIIVIPIDKLSDAMQQQHTNILKV